MAITVDCPNGQNKPAVIACAQCPAKQVANIERWNDKGAFLSWSRNNGSGNSEPDLKQIFQKPRSEMAGFFVL